MLKQKIKEKTLDKNAQHEKEEKRKTFAKNAEPKMKKRPWTRFPKKNMKKKKK